MREGWLLSELREGLPLVPLTAGTAANRAELARLRPNCSLLPQHGVKTVSQGNVLSVLLSSSAGI
jgi:hypothetical protein